MVMTQHDRLRRLGLGVSLSALTATKGWAKPSNKMTPILKRAHSVSERPAHLFFETGLADPDVKTFSRSSLNEVNDE